MILSLPSRLDVGATKTPYQRHIDDLRRTTDLDWAPRAGCQPKNLAMACERCVYGTGNHRADCTIIRAVNPVTHEPTNLPFRGQVPIMEGQYKNATEAR